MDDNPSDAHIVSDVTLTHTPIRQPAVSEESQWTKTPSASPESESDEEVEAEEEEEEASPPAAPAANTTSQAIIVPASISDGPALRAALQSVGKAQ